MEKVYDIMKKHIVAVSEDTSMSAAIKLMETSRVPLLPVLRKGRIVGILTKECIKRQQANEQLKVSDCMKTDGIYFVEASDSVDDAARAMMQSNLPRLAVVNNKVDMECIGIVTATDVLKSKNKA